MRSVSKTSSTRPSRERNARTPLFVRRASSLPLFVCLALLFLGLACHLLLLDFSMAALSNSAGNATGALEAVTTQPVPYFDRLLTRSKR